MTVDELLRELDRRGITVTPTPGGRLHYTSPTAAAFTPDLRDALLAAKPELLARLTGEPRAAVSRPPSRGSDPRQDRVEEAPHPRRSGSRPPAGSPAAATASPIESPRRPPRTASRPAPPNRRPPSSSAPAPQTTVIAALAAPEAVTDRPEPSRTLEPSTAEHERGRYMRRPRVSEPPDAAAAPPLNRARVLWPGTLVGVAIVGLVAWGRRHREEPEEVPPTPTPGSWPGY